MRDNFNFHVRAFGQCDDLHGGTRGKIFRKILRVNFVHRGEVAEVRQEYGAFYDVGEGEFLVVENRLHVFEDAFGLRLDVAGNQVASRGFNGDLSGAKKQIANADGVIIRADGGGRFRGFDDDFGCHKCGGQCRVFEMRGQEIRFAFHSPAAAAAAILRGQINVCR